MPHVSSWLKVAVTLHVVPSAIADWLDENVVHDESEYWVHRATGGYDEKSQ